MIPMVIIFYMIIVSIVAKHALREQPDVAVKNGVLVYTKNFNRGEIVRIPIDLIHGYKINCIFQQIGYNYSWKYELEEHLKK